MYPEISLWDISGISIVVLHDMLSKTIENEGLGWWFRKISMVIKGIFYKYRNYRKYLFGNIIQIIRRTRFSFKNEIKSAPFASQTIERGSQIWGYR